MPPVLPQPTASTLPECDQYPIQFLRIWLLWCVWPAFLMPIYWHHDFQAPSDAKRIQVLAYIRGLEVRLVHTRPTIKRPGMHAITV